MNVCIFGDSITWGARLPFRAAWANLLRNYLEQVSDNFISLYDLGVDGNTSRDLIKRFDVEAVARKPDLIIFAVGTNDSLFHIEKNDNDVSIDEFENNITTLIGKAKTYTDNIVFVGIAKGSDDLTVPLLRSKTGKCYDKKTVRKYNISLQKIAKENDVEFINIEPFLNDNDFDDGLHPNLNGHIKIFEQMRLKLPLYLSGLINEHYILVNNSDEEIGSKSREEVTKNDILRVSGLWISNSKGEVLLSKRPFEKRRDPGKWSPAVACVVEKNLTYESTIKIATLKEIGLSVENPIKDQKLLIEGENTFYCQMYSQTLDLNIADLKINLEEVSELRWFSLKELQDTLSSHPDMFVQSFERYFNLFKNS